MKHSKAKKVDRFEAKEVDVDEVDLDIEEENEEELESEWVVMENDAAETAELDDEADLFEEDADDTPVDEGEFDTVAHYFRESARHKLLPPQRERELTEAVKRGRIARKRLDTASRIVAMSFCEPRSCRLQLSS